MPYRLTAPSLLEQVPCTALSASTSAPSITRSRRRKDIKPCDVPPADRAASVLARHSTQKSDPSVWLHAARADDTPRRLCVVPGASLVHSGRRAVSLVTVGCMSCRLSAENALSNVALSTRAVLSRTTHCSHLTAAHLPSRLNESTACPRNPQSSVPLTAARLDEPQAA